MRISYIIFSVEDESDAVFPTQINTPLKSHIAPRIIIKVCSLHIIGDCH